MNFSPGEINIICMDIQRSLHFYRNILGFEVIEQEGDAVHLRAETHQFLLLPVADETASSAHYCQQATFSVDLMVDDLKAAYDYLADAGVRFERNWQSNARSFIIRDPDELVWEIIQRRD